MPVRSFEPNHLAGGGSGCRRCSYLLRRVEARALELLGRRLEIEHPEVATRHVDRHVEDGRAADPALELARMGVSVEDEIGPELDDRSREALVAEERPDPLRLAAQRLKRRRVVQEDDPERA